jgi:hypothetical protein
MACLVTCMAVRSLARLTTTKMSRRWWTGGLRQNMTRLGRCARDWPQSPSSPAGWLGSTEPLASSTALSHQSVVQYPSRQDLRGSYFVGQGRSKRPTSSVTRELGCTLIACNSCNSPFREDCNLNSTSSMKWNASLLRFHEKTITKIDVVNNIIHQHQTIQHDQWEETIGKYTSGFTCLSCPKILEIILRRAELGENPSQGGT